MAGPTPAIPAPTVSWSVQVTNNFVCCYTLPQRSCWGVYWFHSVRLSIRPASCVRSVAPTILVGSISYLYILSSNFIRCIVCKVSCKIWIIGNFLPEASYGLRVLSLPASVCVCVCVYVCVCVRQSSVCPDDNLSPAQATITKFGPEVQNTLIKIPIVFGVHWPWPSRSNWT